MLERYFTLPKTVERIRSSWLAEAIERYVAWLTGQGYAARTIWRRVPLLVHFGVFTRQQGAATLDELPTHIEGFIAHWLTDQHPCAGDEKGRQRLAKEVRTPIQQMLRVVLPGFTGKGRSCQPENPFDAQAPGFFPYLREERGLREASIRHYSDSLRSLAAYLAGIGLTDLHDLSVPVLGGFPIAVRQQGIGWEGLRNACGALRVFVRYLYREGILTQDLSSAVEAPQTYRLSQVPRSITWDQVRRMLEAVDRRTPVGKRDYAILLLLVTYGLRAREVAVLTLDDIDWRNERLQVPQRKAGHSTAYPLSPIVGNAILAYLKEGRPATEDRHVFFRIVAPQLPLTGSAISGRASHYLHKAGIPVSRPGSHTLRHTCVQRLVDAQFSLDVIGDYVGHGTPRSTEIYAKVNVEALREVACGDGEEIL
jgi:site-specific recombinase XerD